MSFLHQISFLSESIGDASDAPGKMEVDMNPAGLLLPLRGRNLEDPIFPHYAKHSRDTILRRTCTLAVS